MPTEQEMHQGSNVQVIPNAPTPTSTQQINVADFASSLVTDPSLLMNEGMTLSDRVPTVSDEEIAAGTQSSAPAQGDPAAVQATTTQAQTAAPVTEPTPIQAASVQTATTAEQMAAPENQMTGVQGQLSTGSLVNPEDVVADVNATATGQNAVGQALNQAAQQNFSTMIDTSTMAGKLLAEQLGEGNYTDTKATIKGQLDILQSEFFDPSTGDPRIPSWAAQTARNVSRIAAFKGMTGTAATAALAQAMMEASLPIAQADAQFFQTLTVKNLDNRQEQTINKANVLAKLDLQNLDNRLTAAVNNSQNFLKMDLTNLDNEQQAELINTQARIQSILEDAKAENTNRLFVAESQNEKDMFYDNLGASIEQFNAAQKNAMEQFNASESNDVSKFNAELETAREQFYKDMQFQIDTANAKWRQTVTLTENNQKFEAAATDVKNLVGVSVEQLNRIWDRADSLLDYIWKTGDNELDRKHQLTLAKLQGNINQEAADSKGFGEIIGTILGAGASAFFDWLF